MTREQRWRVPAEAAGERLDRHVAARLGVARHQVQRWIRAGAVRVGGAWAKPSSALEEGVEIACAPPGPAPEDRLAPEAGPLAVIWEDEHLVVLDKPAGLAVHRGAGRPDGTLANRLVARYPELEAVGHPARPGIVHRLDIDTTGVMLIARTDGAYQALSRAFAGRGVDKRYLGIVYGDPGAEPGRIEAPIGRHPKERKQMAVVAGGRPAVTGYRRLATATGVTALELRLHTGRTHQIRVHLKHAGHPLVGDPTYGEARWKALPPAVRRPLRHFPRPALHAWRLALPHPATGEPLSFEAPIPPDLAELWRAVGGASLSEGQEP